MIGGEVEYAGGTGLNRGIVIIRYRILLCLSAKRSTLDILRSDNRSSEI